jgi:Trk K+ transport system NAD-binding subunit
VALGRLTIVRKSLDSLIAMSLKQAGLVRALDYELLLRVDHGYGVSEYLMEADNPLVGRELRESRPWDIGVVVLALRRDGVMIPGIPGPRDIVRDGDVLVLYGQESDVRRLMQRDGLSV